MDLRSFSAGNAGCVFELEQLVGRLASHDIVWPGAFCESGRIPRQPRAEGGVG